MKGRRRRQLLGAGVLAAAGLLGVVGHFSRELYLDLSDPVSDANCERIRGRIESGITLAEVRALLRRPPNGEGLGELKGRLMLWTSPRNHRELFVWLDDRSGRVERVSIWNPLPERPSLTDRIRRLWPW
jgi:hypothetical protein